MRKLLITIFIFALSSCNNSSDKTQIVELYNSRIKIPSSLTQKKIDSCENIKTFIDSNKSHLNFKICRYRLVSGRQSFESLNQFFQEECDVLKVEIPKSISINRWSKNYSDNYTFNHDFVIGDKYYTNAFIAFEDYYLAIRLQTVNKEIFKELKKTVETLSEANLSKKIKTLEIDTNCNYCKSPLFW